MSSPFPQNPYQPPPGGGLPAGGPPHGTPPGPGRPSNGMAVTAIILGGVAIGVAIVPLLNAVGVVCGLIAIVVGIIGIRRGRRIGRGTALAVWGIGLAVVGIVVSVVVNIFVLRYLGDLFDTVKPPEPSAEIGEEFDTDDGDLTVTVTSVTCVADDYGHDCDFTFKAHNNSDRSIRLDHIKVKAVVDGEWTDPSFGSTTTTLTPDQTETVEGTVSVHRGALEGLAFDADDASSHSAVVVDVSSAWEQSG